MKNGTLYAKRIKRLFSKLKSEYGKPEPPALTDPIDQLIVGLLASSAPESRALRAAKALKEVMIDVNDLRVSTTAEVTTVISPHVTNGMASAIAIRSALNAIFRNENAVSLSHLVKIGRREAKQYLDKLDGVDAYAAASVILWSLGGHAIPVDRRMYETLRKHDLVEPSASIAEVQAFLERNVAAADARVFCMLMQKFVSAKASKSTGKSGSVKTSRKASSSSGIKSASLRRSSSATKKTAGANKRTTKAAKRTASQ